MIESPSNCCGNDCAYCYLEEYVLLKWLYTQWSSFVISIIVRFFQYPELIRRLPLIALFPLRLRFPQKQQPAKAFLSLVVQLGSLGTTPNRAHTQVICQSLFKDEPSSNFCLGSPSRTDIIVHFLHHLGYWCIEGHRWILCGKIRKYSFECSYYHRSTLQDAFDQVPSIWAPLSNGLICKKCHDIIRPYIP